MNIKNILITTALSFGLMTSVSALEISPEVRAKAEQECFMIIAKGEVNALYDSKFYEFDARGRPVRDRTEPVFMMQGFYQTLKVNDNPVSFRSDKTSKPNGNGTFTFTAHLSKYDIAIKQAIPFMFDIVYQEGTDLIFQTDRIYGVTHKDRRNDFVETRATADCRFDTTTMTAIDYVIGNDKSKFKGAQDNYGGNTISGHVNGSYVSVTTGGYIGNLATYSAPKFSERYKALIKSHGKENVQKIQGNNLIK